MDIKKNLNPGDLIKVEIKYITGELKKSRVDSRFLRKIFGSLFKNINQIPDFFGKDFCKNHNLAVF